MNILVIGSGGREHALCWKIAQSSMVETLYAAPGNGGITEHATCIDLDIDNARDVKDFCLEKSVGLVVIGPEAPLVAGLANALRAAHIPVFGPDKAAAQLEGSKAFTKALCDRHHIPTAAYGQFTDAKAARAYIQAHGAPIVVKADGLAAGKGVIVAMTEAEALEAVDDIFGGKFGDAGLSVVIEEYLEGEEVSFFALCDGTRVIECGSAQDHKRVGEGDTGPNTGGMGTYSPAPRMTESLRREVMETIIHPTVEGLKAEGMPYCGVLFAGLMLTESGVKLLEYNVRFGDPECQVLMTRFEGDLVPVLLACAEGTLTPDTAVSFKDKAALCVVMAAEGYPGSYKKGTEIHNVEKAAAMEGVVVFHAGTARDRNRLMARGGRVLGVTAIGNTIKEAQTTAYKAVDAIDWPEGFCRRDIGWRAVANTQEAA